VIVIRYADDTIVGFEHRHEAEQFLIDLKAQLARFGLTLHPDKTRLIEFGRFAIANRHARGLGKPESFDFLGFTHYCANRRDGGGYPRAILVRWIRKYLRTKAPSRAGNAARLFLGGGARLARVSHTGGIKAPR